MSQILLLSHVQLFDYARLHLFNRFIAEPEFAEIRVKVKATDSLSKLRRPHAILPVGHATAAVYTGTP